MRKTSYMQVDMQQKLCTRNTALFVENGQACGAGAPSPPPFRCPRCGEHERFHSLAALRAHLDYNHTYDPRHNLSLPASRGSGPLPHDQTADTCSEQPASPKKSAAGGELSIGTKLLSAPVASVGQRLEGMIRTASSSMERRLLRLSSELAHTDTALLCERAHSHHLAQERQEVLEREQALSRQVNAAVMVIATLRQQLSMSEHELERREQEVLAIQKFLEAAAQHEMCGKVRLRRFIEGLLRRIALAERLLEYYQSTPHEHYCPAHTESNWSMMRKCHMGIRLGGEHPGHLGRDGAIMAGSRAGGQGPVGTCVTVLIIRKLCGMPLHSFCSAVKDNMNSLIQRLARQALATFRNQASEDSKGFVENHSKLRNLLAEVRVSDLKIVPRCVESTYVPPQLLGPPVTYMHICETDSFSMGVFLLKHGSSIPLHDHPNMYGLLKVLYGKVRVSCYDRLDSSPDSASGRQFNPPLLPFQKSCVRPSVQRSVGEYTEESPPCVLYPQRDNLHQIEAVDGPTAFLDILAPPYDPDDGRDCHYYKVLQQVPEGQLFQGT
ncbi:hypothetical protein QTP86_005669 [Hemibagrus guttatus]|nr:hypothetical protein QTP86_005669 [Hemibagrus guttatus]